MDEYLNNLGYDFWKTSVNLTDGLNRLLKCELLNDKDLIILNSGGQFIPNTPIESATDRCEYEDFENHFHIDDYVAYKMNFNDLHFLGLGLEFLKQLTNRLINEFPNKCFRISLSFGKVEDTDVYEFGNCVVRFYSIRKEAEKIFKVSDLNSFNGVGIIEIEVNK